MSLIIRKYITTSLVVKVTMALILGLITGLLINDPIISIIEPFGELLIRLLMFLILPLIFFSLIVGINQTNIRHIGRMGSKVFLYYLFTSALAIIIGLIIASLLSPGDGMTLDLSESYEAPSHPGIAAVLLNIVPRNIVTAFSELNLLGIIFTAIVFGLAISALRDSKEHQASGDLLYRIADGLNEASFKVMHVILQYLPVGIFAIIATTTASQGFDTIGSLAEVVLVLYLALAVQFGFYLLLIKSRGLSVKQFSKAIRTPMLTAFATQSSAGTLPLSMEAAKKLKLNKSLYSFSLPFGATLNMDGAAIRIAVSVVFAANVIGQSLSMGQLFTVVLVGTLASIGTAGVPGAGIVMISTVFLQLGLPMEAVALLVAIDALVGMGCTAINVVGDLTGTVLINETETQDKQAA